MREYRIFNNGKLTFLEAINIDTKKDLQIYTHVEQEDYRSFFIVFDELVKPKNSITFRWTVHVENFFDELIQQHSSHVDRRPSLVMIYDTIEENYKFPDIPLFKNLNVKIKRHPNSDLINKQIVPICKDGYKYYKIEHGDLSNFNIEIEVIFDNQ